MAVDNDVKLIFDLVSKKKDKEKFAIAYGLEGLIEREFGNCTQAIKYLTQLNSSASAVLSRLFNKIERYKINLVCELSKCHSLAVPSILVVADRYRKEVLIEQTPKEKRKKKLGSNTMTVKLADRSSERASTRCYSV